MFFICTFLFLFTETSCPQLVAGIGTIVWIAYKPFFAVTGWIFRRFPFDIPSLSEGTAGIDVPVAFAIVGEWALCGYEEETEEGEAAEREDDN